MFQILHHPFSVEGVHLSVTLTFSSKPKWWYVVIFILSYFISTASIKGLQGIAQATVADHIEEIMNHISFIYRMLKKL